MYAKLALRNVLRTAKDYTVYFVTLLLGVAMFYAFNSVSEQQFMLDIENAASDRIFQLTGTLMTLLSFVVAVVMAFLMLYANRFIFVRRKREFGMYLMLGMTPAKVARVVLYETLAIGVVALVAGLAVGVLLSQLLAFVTAGLMGTVMQHYEFVVSTHAINLTLLCFATIFVLTALLNVFTVTRRRLASLLSTSRQNEAFGVKRIGLRLAAFALSLVVLGLAYWQLHVNKLELIDSHFGAATALMLAGTLLFYWSVSGVGILLIQKAKGVYFRGLGMFTTRQVASKANTAFVSMSVVSVTLFFAITVLACGMGLVKLFVMDLEDVTRFDATIRADYYYEPGASSLKKDSDFNYERRLEGFKESEPPAYERWLKHDGDMAAAFADTSSAWGRTVKASAQIDRYKIEDLTYADILGKDPITQDSSTDQEIRQTNLAVVGVSQFNDMLALTGKKPLELAEGECVINNTMDMTQKAAERLADSGATIRLGSQELRVGKTLMNQPVQTSAMKDVGLDFIVPDSAIQELKDQGALPYTSFLNVMYKGNRAEGDAGLAQALGQALPLPASEDMDTGEEFEHLPTLWPASQVTLASDMIAQAQGFRMMITYLAMYVGLIMLVSTAAILAIQQLSETADSLPRYRKLFQLGADSRMILGSLRTQTLAYFLLPLVLAVCHSACALIVMENTLFKLLGVSMGGSILAAAGLVVLVYDCYLGVTYALSRAMVASQFRRATS